MVWTKHIGELVSDFCPLPLIFNWGHCWPPIVKSNDQFSSHPKKTIPATEKLEVFTKSSYQVFLTQEVILSFKKIFFSKFIISFFKYFFYLKFFSYFYFIKKNFFSSNPCVKGWLSIDCSKGAALLHMKPLSRSRSSTNGLALGSPCLLFFWKKILSEPRPFLLFLIPHWTLIPFPLLVFPNFRNASVGVESPRAQSHGLISLYRLIFLH